MKRGFLLIELVIAVGLFGVATFLASGLVLSLMNAQKKAIATRSLMDNVGFAVELMTKEIRVGNSFHCGLNNFDIGITPQDCSFSAGGGPSFTFKNTLNQTITYRVTSGQLEKSWDGGFNFLPLTSPDVNIENIRFYVSGSSPLDNIQPRATVVLKVLVGVKFPAKINIQTTVTQRKIDK